MHTCILVKLGGKRKTHKVCKKTCKFYEMRRRFAKVGGNNNFPEIGREISENRVPRQLVYGHFVYRHFVYYCIPAYRTIIHPTSVSANHYFHQFQRLLTLRFLFINPTSTDTMIIQHI